jgi:hypothetical protein
MLAENGMALTPARDPLSHRLEDNAAAPAVQIPNPGVGFHPGYG